MEPILFNHKIWKKKKEEKKEVTTDSFIQPPKALVKTIFKFGPNLTGLIQAVLPTLNERLTWTQEKYCIEMKKEHISTTINVNDGDVGQPHYFKGTSKPQNKT